MRAKSLMSKLLLSYLVIALVPLFIVMGILINLNISAVKRDIQDELDSVTKLISTQFEAVLNTMSFISLDLMADDEFTSAVNGLSFDNNTVYEEARCYAIASNEICSYSYTSAAYYITFFNWRRNFMTSYDYNWNYSYQYRLPEEYPEKLEWLDLVLYNYGKTVLLPVSNQELPNIDVEALTLVRSVRNPGKVIGFLAVQIAKEDLDHIFDISSLKNMDYLVLYGDKIIYGSNDFPFDQKSLVEAGMNWEEFQSMLSKDYLVSSQELKDSGIRVVMTADMELIYERTQETVGIYILEGICILALTLVVIVIFVKQMYKPLIALTKEMQGTTIRNLNTESNTITYEKYSETRALYHEFINMKQRFDVMINNEIMLKTLQTRERLNYLQSQINPHFLYNTLNIIGIMGADNGCDRVYDSCLKLSKLLKYAIPDKNNSVVTFYEEFQNIQLYLELMKLRFEDRLFYQIDCEEGLYTKKTLNLILQPFVENIFEHSLDVNHTTIALSVRGRMEKEQWVITIEDNGVGMDAEQLERMNEKIQVALRERELYRNYSDDCYGIGVQNTLIRLSIYYDGKFSYRIENRGEGGFRVVLIGEMDAEE